jgi:hypothetical protein
MNIDPAVALVEIPLEVVSAAFLKVILPPEEEVGLLY